MHQMFPNVPCIHIVFILLFCIHRIHQTVILIPRKEYKDTSPAKSCMLYRATIAALLFQAKEFLGSSTCAGVLRMTRDKFVLADSVLSTFSAVILLLTLKKAHSKLQTHDFLRKKKNVCIENH